MPSIKIDWNSENIDEHRKGISDLDWAGMQRTGQPKYKLGNKIEFMVGGFGVIVDVSISNTGWPVQYSTRQIKNMKYHPKNKLSWHYEGDIRRKVA